MSWQIHFNDEDGGQEKVHVDIRPGNIKSVPKNRITHTLTDALMVVPKASRRSKTLGWRAVFLLEKIRQNYRIGQLFSYQEIKRRFGWKADSVTAYAMNRLWRAGYVEKLAAGFWKGGLLKSYKQKYGHVGRYHGVHYRLIDDRSSKNS